jgi:hypothetical protein
LAFLAGFVRSRMLPSVEGTLVDIENIYYVFFQTSNSVCFMRVFGELYIFSRPGMFQFVG